MSFKVPPWAANTPRNQFLFWMKSQDKREDKEWASWDGTYEDGARIVDMQCERMEEAKKRYGWPMGLACVCEGPKCQCDSLVGVELNRNWALPSYGATVALCKLADESQQVAKAEILGRVVYASPGDAPNKLYRLYFPQMVSKPCA